MTLLFPYGPFPDGLFPYSLCAAAYLALAGLIVLQARRSRTGKLLAAAAAVTALWAAATAGLGRPLDGVAGGLDLLRGLAWYGFVLHLYRRARVVRRGDLFGGLGLAAAAGVAAVLLSGQAGADGVVSLLSPGVLLRLGLAVCQLLLLENLYRGSARDTRWHIGMACVALGGLAAYDVVLCADAALFRAASPVLLQGRAMAAVLVTPLLALAAARNRDWKIDIHVSRAAVFHSATLVASGVFLLALAAVGELTRRFAGAARGWGDVAQVSLLFAGLLTVAVLLTSGAARARLRRALVDHFFTHRFDYRREWLRCIEILSDPGPASAADGAAPLASRVIRAVAEPVDSPAGLLFTRDPAGSGDCGMAKLGMVWAGGWNHAPLPPLPPGHPLLAALADAGSAIVLHRGVLAAPPTTGLQAWLAVPLRAQGGGSAPSGGSAEKGALAGCILLAPPRAPFRLDAEVFDLLRILAREVAIHLAEQAATRRLLETQDLRAYGERFAFVAHDIKNVASQLALLLSNAETHLANPAFQLDMLATVRASVAKIAALIRRLQPADPAPPAVAPAAVSALPPPSAPAPATDPATDPAAVLADLAARPTGGARVTLEQNGPPAGVRVAMAASALEAAVGHLLDNAAAAAGPAGRVRLGLHAADGVAVIEISDDGPGMTAEFIRDQLFRPFSTTRAGGSGIGAFQARALLRAAGGDLAVDSRPAPAPGHGTTLRLTLPLSSLLAATS